MTRSVALFVLMTLLGVAPRATASSAHDDLIRAQALEASSQRAGVSASDGFTLQSADEAFSLRFQGHVQFRYIANIRDTDERSDDFEGGFQARRIRISFSGHAYEIFEYKLTLSNERDSGEIRLSDGWISAELADGVSMKWGQFKLPLLRERLASAKRLLAADRSMVDAVFSQGRSQGVELALSSERLSASLAFSDGLRSANTDFDDDDTDWAITTRAEWTIAGNRTALRDLTGEQGRDFSAILGGAFHIEESADRPGESAEALYEWTADLTLAGDGWSSLIAGVGRRSDAEHATDWGVLAQASLFVTETTAPFLRYDAVIPDTDRNGDEVFSTITAGFNYFLHGHAAKFTFDVQWFLDAADDNDLIRDRTGIGYLAGDEDEIVVRAQFQLLF